MLKKTTNLEYNTYVYAYFYESVNHVVNVYGAQIEINYFLYKDWNNIVIRDWEYHYDVRNLYVEFYFHIDNKYITYLLNIKEIDIW